MNSTPIFDPSLLSVKNHQGITQNSMEQLTNWVLGEGNSIKVLWVPDQLTGEIANQTFSYIGNISKIVFESNSTGMGRNMRVYFSEWATTAESYAIRNTIAMHYPQRQPIQCSVNMGAGIMKSFLLQTTINLEIDTQEDKIAKLTKQLEDLKAYNAGCEDEIDALRYQLYNQSAAEDDSDDEYPRIYPENIQQKNMAIMRHLKFGGLRHLIDENEDEEE